MTSVAKKSAAAFLAVVMSAVLLACVGFVAPDQAFAANNMKQVTITDKTSGADGRLSNRLYNDGKKIKPALALKYYGTTLKQGKDYTVTYHKNTKVGMGYVAIKGKGSYAGTRYVPFKIVPQKPQITSLSAENKSISVDWEALDSDQVDGYTVYASPKGSNASDKTMMVSVPGADETSATLSNLQPGVVYTVTVQGYKHVISSYKETALTRTDFNDSMFNSAYNRVVGQAWTVEGQLSDSKEVTTMGSDKTGKSTFKASLRSNKSVFVYDGTPVTLEGDLLVKDAKTNTELSAHSSFNIAYHNNVNVGQGSAVLTGRGVYAGTTSVVIFEIDPKTVKNVAVTGASKALKVSWTSLPAAQADGYVVVVSETKNAIGGSEAQMMKGFAISEDGKVMRSQVVKGANSSKVTIKSLSKKKTYYVSVAAYKNFTQTGDYSLSSTAVGSYSKPIKVTTK